MSDVRSDVAIMYEEAMAVLYSLIPAEEREALIAAERLHNIGAYVAELVEHRERLVATTATFVREARVSQDHIVSLRAFIAQVATVKTAVTSTSTPGWTTAV